MAVVTGVEWGVRLGSANHMRCLRQNEVKSFFFNVNPVTK